MRAFATKTRSSKLTCNQTRRDRFHITFHSRDLAREKYTRVPAQLQGVRQQGRRVDVSIAMDLAVAKKLGILKARNQAKNALLLTEPKMVLKTDQVVAVSPEVLLSKLHRGIRAPSGRGSVRPIGFIGPKRRVSRPRRAISSMGRQASKYGTSFEICESTACAVIRSSRKRSY